MEHENLTSIIKRTTIDGMVDAYLQGVREIRETYSHLEKFHEVMTSGFTLSDFQPRFPDGFEQGILEIRTKNKDRVEEVITNITKQAWEVVIGHTNAKKYMTETRAREFNKQLDRGDFPPFTAENVWGLLENLSQLTPSHVNEIIREAYDILTKGNRLKSYKTNEKFQNGLGMKVVLSHWVEEKDRSSRGGKPGNRMENYYRTIDNAFHLLDGKGAIKTHYGSLYDAVYEAWREKRKEGQTEYFGFRTYQNGNLYLEFKRSDLVDRMNALFGEGKVTDRS